MTELISKLTGAHLIPIVAILGFFVTATVVSVARQWRRVRIAEIEATLKEEMIKRGMTAEEIERVLRASPEGRKLETAEECVG